MSFLVSSNVVSLKTELAGPEDATLMDVITSEELEEATRLVDGRTIGQLMARMGPHKDTVLAILVAQNQRQRTGRSLAQIHAVTLRLAGHEDKRVGG